MDVPAKRVRSYSDMIAQFYSILFLIFISFSSFGEYQVLSDSGLERVTAQADLPSIPLLDGVDFNVGASGIEIDLDIQADIGSIEWQDEDGTGAVGSAGALILKGVHLGSSTEPITAEMVRSDTPFAPSDLARIHGMLVEADPEKGTLITINQMGDTQGNGLDLIVNDIYFGKDLSSEGQRGLGLLVEDLSNFVSDDYLARINKAFGLKLSSLDDGFNTQGGNYYPIKLRMQPLEGGVNSTVLVDSGLGGSLDDLAGIGNLGQTSMILDAQFVVYVDKIAVFKDDWEAGIKGLMVYQGIDTTGDGIEDTVGPATLSNMRMETIDHQLADGSTVQAMHFSNIDFKADIAMENIYIGNPETGSLGAIHIDNLHIQDTKMWIYPHD